MIIYILVYDDHFGLIRELGKVYFSSQDIHWKYSGSCEPIQDVPYLWDRHGASIQGTCPW